MPDQNDHSWKILSARNLIHVVDIISITIAVVTLIILSADLLWPDLEVKNLNVLSVLILAGISINLGIERIILYRKQQESFNNISESIRLVNDNTSNFPVIEGHIINTLEEVLRNTRVINTELSILNTTKEIYEKIIQVIDNLSSNDEMMITGFSFRENPDGRESKTKYMDYINKIIEKIEKSKEHGEMSVKLVLSTRNDAEKGVNMYDIFTDSGLGKRIDVRFSTIDCPIDFFIAGKTVIVVFSSYYARNSRQFAIALNGSDITRRFAKWYNDVLLDPDNTQRLQYLSILQDSVNKYSQMYQNKINSSQKKNDSESTS